MAWRVLNLGCGMRTYDRPDVWNVDITRHHAGINQAYDLNKVPWPWGHSGPWGDGGWDEVVARAVFEHLDIRLQDAMNEAWRMLRVGGIADVKLPYWKAEMSYNDMQHRYQVGLGIFDEIDPRKQRGNAYWFYTDRKWLILRVGLNNSQTSVCGRLRKLSLDDAALLRRLVWGGQAMSAEMKQAVDRWCGADQPGRLLVDVVREVK